MLLYHYSADRYSSLKTVEKQGKVTPEDRKVPENIWYERPGRYFEHISFFFDPVPLESIASYFPKDHRVWHSGQKLFQYLIDTRKIGDFKFEVVEFPEKTKLYYDESLTIEAYYKAVLLEMDKNGYMGQGSEALDTACMKFTRTTKEHFKKIPSRPNYSEIKYKYAATVPHVMVYPETGEIDYISIRNVVVK